MSTTGHLNIHSRVDHPRYGRGRVIDLLTEVGKPSARVEWVEHLISTIVPVADLMSTTEHHEEEHPMNMDWTLDDELAEAECAAEAANERALYGPTEAMLADYEIEREREAHDEGLMLLSDPDRMQAEWEAYNRWIDHLNRAECGNDWEWGEVA